MNSDKWQKVKAVFEKVADLPPEQRSKELKLLTDSDSELQAEVESLLDFDSQKQVICTSATPLEGNTSGAIVGDYRLCFPLAINEKTEVWQAVNQAIPEDSDDRRVAIKFFKDLHGDERRLLRFRQEASILSRFNHPSIARFLAEGETESGVPWFSTCYVEGLDLLSMANRLELGLEQRLELFDQVCAALEYSHRFLVIHRDIKPANIVVDEAGKAVLIDFGISKQLDTVPTNADQLTRTFERTLTPAYASPEQLRGEPVSAVTDVYGAGLVLYELICGHHPYSDAVHPSQKSLFDRILFQLPVPPSEAVTLSAGSSLKIGSESQNAKQALVVPDRGADLKIDESLNRIVMKAIAKASDQRYQSISELRRHLVAWSEGNPLSNDDSTNEQSWIQRNAIICSIGACLLGVVVTMALMSLRSKGDSVSSDQLRLLENISNSSVDMDSLVESDWKSLGVDGKLALADLAIEEQQFGKATQIANEIEPSQLEPAAKLQLARQWSDLGFPDRAFSCADLDDNSFEALVDSQPSNERWRRLLCEIYLAMGRPTMARKINEAGLRASVADRFEFELTEIEIRESSQWFDGFESRLQAAQRSLSNSRIRDKDRRDFADLMLRHRSTEAELRQALLDLDDQPGEWSRSKAKLHLAKKLLANGDELEGKTLLIELVREFQARQLPLHPIVLQTSFVAATWFVEDLELVEWWNQHGSDLALSHPDSLALFSEVAKLDRNQLRHYESLRPWLPKINLIEYGPLKITLLREIWRGALESDDRDGASLLIDILLTASGQYIDKKSIEYAEVLAIVSMLERYVGKQNEKLESERFEKIKEIRAEVIGNCKDNIAASFLKAIDVSSPDAVFKVPANSKVKSTAGWFREFEYHRANRTSDQLEMVAWFSEFHSESNPEDVRRLIEEARKYRNKKDWGPKGDANWQRVDAISTQVSK